MAYIFYMFYTIIGGAYGLAVNNLASGLLVLLFLLCLYEVGVQALSVTRIIAYPLACGIYIHSSNLSFLTNPGQIRFGPSLFG